MQTLSIGQAARLLGVSTDTLRNWDESGKLVPARTETGQRRYTLKQIDDIRESEKGHTTIEAHCVKIGNFKKTVAKACEGFKDSDTVTLWFSKNNGYNGVGIGIKHPSKVTMWAVDFEAYEVVKLLAGDDTFDFNEAMMKNFEKLDSQ